MKKFEAILCIVNRGFADAAMDAARAVGAKGGTVLHGRGTASPEAEKLFNISVQPEKEIALILVAGDIRDAVLKSLYEAVGTATPAQGFAFSLPVEEVAGLSKPRKKNADKAERVAERSEEKAAEKASEAAE